MEGEAIKSEHATLPVRPIKSSTAVALNTIFPVRSIGRHGPGPNPATTFLSLVRSRTLTYIERCKRFIQNGAVLARPSLISPVSDSRLVPDHQGSIWRAANRLSQSLR